jgi:hypothetical protein
MVIDTQLGDIVLYSTCILGYKVAWLKAWRVSVRGKMASLEPGVREKIGVSEEWVSRAAMLRARTDCATSVRRALNIGFYQYVYQEHERIQYLLALHSRSACQDSLEPTCWDSQSGRSGRLQSK